MISWNLNNLKQNLFAIGATAACVGYFFSIATGSIGMMIFVLAWILNFRKIKFSQIFKNKSIYFIYAFYLLVIICSFYSVNEKQAQKEIMRFLSFAVFPLIFVTSNITQRDLKFIKKGFIICLTIFFVICFTNAIIRQVIFSESGGPFNWYFFYRYDFLEIFRQHPTYMSMFTLLGLCFLVFESGDNVLFKNKFIKVLLISVLIFALLLYGSRIAYIIFAILSSIYVFNLFKKSKLKEVLIILSIFIFLIILAWNIPIVKERVLFTFGEKYEYQFNNPNSIINGTPENQGRLLLWQNAFDLIEEKVLFGYGTGSSKQILAEKYEKEGHEVFLKEKYNAHNTYIELLLWGGIVLLLSYLAMLFYMLRKSILTKDIFLFSFFTIILITGITETIFLAQGIMFFAFFYSFFLNKTANEQK